MAESVSDVLRAARLRRHLTQEQVGRLLDPPISHSLISRYEAGLRVPSATLVQLAKILRFNVTVSAAINELESVAS